MADRAAYATKQQPICRAADNDKDKLQTPAGFLSLTVCVLLAFIIVCILMACCITHCRSATYMYTLARCSLQHTN